jgi:hypothetical protein
MRDCLFDDPYSLLDDPLLVVGLLGQGVLGLGYTEEEYGRYAQLRHFRDLCQEVV